MANIAKVKIGDKFNRLTVVEDKEAEKKYYLYKASLVGGLHE